MFAKTDKPVRIALNKLMHDNYAFFCPVTLLHLSLSRPLGMITVLSDSIERGLKAGTLIDVDNKIDLEHHCFIDGNNQNLTLLYVNRSNGVYEGVYDCNYYINDII